MVKYYPSLDDNLSEWCLQQSVFFVASAPLTGKHINLSPKGLPSTSFSILGPNEAAYIDGTGSGNETISHLHENGRITLMFCSFLAAPRILRLFCTGRVVEWDRPQFPRMLDRMAIDPIPAARAILHFHIFKVSSLPTTSTSPSLLPVTYLAQVQTSCGFGVPLLSLTTDPHTDKPKAIFEDRDTIVRLAAKATEEKTRAYQAANNSDSLDGLPGLRVARKTRGDFLLIGDVQNWLRRHRQPTDLLIVSLLSVVTTVAVLQWAGLTTFHLF